VDEVRLKPAQPGVKALPLAELRSVKGNDGADVQFIMAAPASTVLTKGAGFEFGVLGVSRNKRDVLARDEREAFDFADVSHRGVPLPARPAILWKQNGRSSPFLKAKLQRENAMGTSARWDLVT